MSSSTHQNVGTTPAPRHASTPDATMSAGLSSTAPFPPTTNQEHDLNHLHIPILTELGKDISSRHQAAILRRRICEHIDSTHGSVELDFADVRTVSESTADELIAVLAVARGDLWFRKHVRISHLKPRHQDVLTSVYDERKKRGVHASELPLSSNG